ncbi:protease HtpX [Algiphilus sp. W345]|uniref:Protease HtpX n=1 Tax=Banduia mediterranea TaxID=3075609 RepID=A0ABU2WHQ7_9GAMM|nr:protease HtpX [Algiphilus sp. W345]MDT0497403.1 protease HtpX [Algiphilus sp. W345]
MKRILLFLGTNIAVVLVLSIVTSVLGVNRWFTANGLNYEALLIFCAVFGFGGAFISLAISKPIAKWSTGAKLITQPRNSAEAWLLSTVQRQARQAGIGMPEVAVFDSPVPNAFATGASKNKALVAVSSGLMNSMTQEEVEAVLGHEISHVANGDMVTLTLIQGVVNTFVMFLARVVGYFVDQFVFRRGSDSQGIGMGYYLCVIVLEIVFGILASAIVCWFSRQREFRADAGGAHLAGRRKMVSALQRLQSFHEAPNQLPQQIQAFGIRGGKMAKMFSTHPPLEERIARLNQAAA